MLLAKICPLHTARLAGGNLTAIQICKIIIYCRMYFIKRHNYWKLNTIYVYLKSCVAEFTRKRII